MNLYGYKPQSKFAQKHLLCFLDYTSDEIRQLISLALYLKKQQKEGLSHKHLNGKTLAMIFSKSSTRTRVSFEVGTHQLGGHALFLSSQDIQISRGETIQDTARVLSRMVDGIMIRTFDQSVVEDLAKYGSIPIINGLTDLLHPCQALGDLMTLYEKSGELEGKKLAFIGDGNNMCHSLMIVCAKLGVHFAIAYPKGYEPHADIVAAASAVSKSNGATITLTHDPMEAAAGADAIYTDVWASMGQEGEITVRQETFQNYSVTAELMQKANKNAVFMHCLPAHRGEEVSAEVIDGPQSVVFDEAENRLHIQKAIMAMLMSGMTYEELMK